MCPLSGISVVQTAQVISTHTYMLIIYSYGLGNFATHSPISLYVFNGSQLENNDLINKNIEDTSSGSKVCCRKKSKTGGRKRTLEVGRRKGIINSGEKVRESHNHRIVGMEGTSGDHQVQLL